MEKDIYTNESKDGRFTILIPCKVNFLERSITRNKDWHLVVVKESLRKM